VPKRLSIAAKKEPALPVPAVVESTKANVVRFPTPVKVKNPAAVALGKLGGSKGGKIRAARLSPEARKAIAQQAAKARWAKEKSE
jgi:hypothetical protein